MATLKLDIPRHRPICVLFQPNASLNARVFGSSPVNYNLLLTADVKEGEQNILNNEPKPENSPQKRINYNYYTGDDPSFQ